MSERERIAFEIVELAKAQVLANNHYLSMAVGHLRSKAGQTPLLFATDTSNLFVNPQAVCDYFLKAEEPPTHDYLHTLLHCIFLHPFVGASINRTYWNLACDIAVEKIVLELCGPRAESKGKDISEALGMIENSAKDGITAEWMYKQLCDGRWPDLQSQWAELFLADDHGIWYADISIHQPVAYAYASKAEANSSANGLEESIDAPDLKQGDSTHELSESSAFTQNESDDNAALKRAPDYAESSDSSYRKDRGSGLGTHKRDLVFGGHYQNLKDISKPNSKGLKNTWRRIAKTLTVDLQMYSKNRGDKLKSLADALETATQNRMDYSDFLRQFAIPGEVLKLSEDEFDYIFYTYGLKLYGNMPLVEPLEYREEKRIREFVIVLDTSGSVYSSTLTHFVDTTFNILRSTESFFERVHVRIIQCDSAVRSDEIIRSIWELKQWCKSMRVYGNGGTDFRPAFEYVDSLIENGEFENLGGLVYFTDGEGVYPNWVPRYKTAFVFHNAKYNAARVPPWAAQIVLEDKEHNGSSLR